MRTTVTALSLLVTTSFVTAEPAEAWLDAKTAIQAMQQGELSSEQLVRYYLARIAEHTQGITLVLGHPEARQAAAS